MRTFLLALFAAAPLWLTACDQLGIESASAVAGRRESEGKAIGAGCRHAARSVEQCYELNKRAEKSSIFAGWREMNDYMRENKLEAMPAVEPTQVAAVADGQAPETKPGEAKTEDAKPGAVEAPAKARPKAGAKP